MSKTVSDDLRKISVSFLKKNDYFVGFRNGNITWTNSWSPKKSSVTAHASILENYFRLIYSQTDNETGEKKDFDYKIPLTTTPCHYGGKRYWFTCPMYKNQVYCGRRVGTLYKNGDYFACRHCYNLTYESRNLSGRYKMFGSVTGPDIDKAREKVKITHYRGKPTRKYLSYLKKEKKLENAFIGMAYYFEKKSKLIP